MEDILYSVLLSGDEVLAWVATLLAGLFARYILVKIGREVAQKYLGRSWIEVKSAVAEVYQTYVSALKEANLDGKLTAEEKAEAKSRALKVAKANIGKKGLSRLLRILGLESDALDTWLGTQVEAAVDLSKKEGAAAKSVTSPLP